MNAIYSFSIFIYALIIKLISPFNSKAKLWYTGRKEFNIKTLSEFEGAILIQASSLGEYEQAKPLIDSIKTNYPDKKIVLSFFSPSGYEAKKNIKIVDKVIYLPIDTPSKSKEFVNILKPEMVFFIKYDFWPNLYKHLAKSGSKIYLVSTIFRENQAFFKWYGKWYRHTLKYVDFFFVQNQKSIDLLNSIGLTNSKVTGDTRFDQVLALKNIPFSDTIIERFVLNSDQVVVAGSTWFDDEKLILECINKYPDWKWIIAPHEVHNNHISQIKTLFNQHKTICYSQSENEINLEKSNVLIIDSIGMLKHLYKYGKLAYIGGGFGKGIHNTLEAAVYGIPVLFGPKHYKFQEAQDLLKHKIGVEIDQSNIIEVFKTVSDLSYRKKIKKETPIYIEKQKGAINKIMKYLS